MICKCWICKRPKSEDELDFCERCGQGTCFDCVDESEYAELTCCEALQREKEKSKQRNARQKVKSFEND